MEFYASKNDISMQGIDTILAMPQWYVNYNLRELLEYGTTIEGKSLKDISLQMQGNNWLTGRVSSLSTSLYVDGSVKKVKFIITFESGTMEYYDIYKLPPEKMQADISGLVFGFLVNLSFEDLVSEEDLPDDVKKQILERMSKLGEGAFTIQQFFMDLTEAAVSTPDSTITHYPTGFSDSAKAVFPIYMATYINGIRSAGGHVLGYGVKVQNPGGVDDPVASYPPTLLEFVTNRYIGYTGQIQTDLDCILYLMMTGNNPTFPPNLAPWWGNYVVPGDDVEGVYGCMAMSGGIFVKQFLLSRLAPIVCTYWELQNTNNSLDISSRDAVGQFTPTADGGTWSTGQISSLSKKNNTFSADDAAYNSSFEVTLSIGKGDNKIVILRTMYFDVEVTHWYGVRDHSISSSIHVWYEIPTTITITMDGLDKGALQVNVDVKNKEADPSIAYGDPYGWLITKVKGSESIWKEVGDLQERCINDAVNVAVPKGLGTNIKNKIEQSLNLMPFIFPGGSQLYMKNPAFNYNGDLLVGIQYKG